MICQQLHRAISIALALLIGTSTGVLADPRLRMPDGSSVMASELPFFKDRPKILGYLEKVVSTGSEGEMGLATTPKFCPRYSYTSWGGIDPHTRAAGRCQTRVDKLLKEYEWPVSLHSGCKCVLAIRNMEVLDKSVLMTANRFTGVKLFVQAKDGKIIQRDGVLEYQKSELVKQQFSLFNEEKQRICEGSLDLKVGELGKFSGSCLGGNQIVDGGVSVFCPVGLFCKRHLVGNMKMGNGLLIGFVSGISNAQIKEKYPDFPEKFEVQQAPQEQENEFSD